MARLLGVRGAGKGVKHVFCIERVTIVEGHALTQLDRINEAIFRHLPAFSKVAFGHEIVVDVHQAGVDVRGNLELQHLTNLSRVQRGDL